MSEMLKDLIDWERVMAAPRFAGGHEEVMRVLFKGADVLAEWVEDDWQGEEAFAYLLPDGRVALVTDYFGSCSGCDLWEGATDEEARRLCIALANNARVFPNLDAAVVFLRTEANEAHQFSMWAARNLLPQLESLAKGNSPLTSRAGHGRDDGGGTANNHAAGAAHPDRATAGDGA